MKTHRTQRNLLGAVLGATALTATAAMADNVIFDDQIVVGSLCVGQDCSNGESFGFDTIRLKENNLRIKFQDTSNTASFPSNDWQITANDSSNGGANKFSVDDIDGGRTPFTIEAGARTNALYVEADGDIGIGTNNPTVDLHIVSGNTPTARLEQDGSSGFQSQTWDLAGNEANFFIRDVTNGSALPFRIKPSAPSDSLFVDSTGNIGMGTSSPGRDLVVRRTGSAEATEVQFESTNATGGAVQVRLVTNNNTNRRVAGFVADGDIASAINLGDDEVIILGTMAQELARINTSGITLPAGATYVPDYVFAPDYKLMPLAELQAFVTENSHLPGVPSASEIGDKGLNMTDMHFALLEKVEELTLYTLQQQKLIEELQAKLP